MRNSPSPPIDLRPLMIGAVILVGLIGALFAGQAVAAENYRLLVLIVGGSLAILIPLIMRDKVWVLIPVTWLLTGTVGVLPLPFSVRELGILAAFGSFVVYSLMKKVSRPAPLGVVDGILIINIVYLITVYFRNPAGVLFFQTDIVGARPYFSIVITLLGFWVLQRAFLTPRLAFWLPAMQSIGAVLASLVAFLTSTFPFLVPIIYPIYSGVSIESYMNQSVVGSSAPSGDQRKIEWLVYAKTVVPVLLSYVAPVKLVLFLVPLRSLIFYTATIGMLYSGFRSGIAYLGVFVLLAAYFREGTQGLVRAIFGVLLAVVVLFTLSNAGVWLPVQAQRALSFLPGQWDYIAVEDASASSEWRFEMWKSVLSSDRYIKDKIFGDGFGYDLKVLAAFVAKTMPGQGGVTPEDVQEYFMITGSYHSGPISAIRYVGVVGLFLFTVLLVASARYAWKIIRLAKNTPFFPLALFVGIPVIYKPFEYWFVFGGLDSDYPQAIMALALLNLTYRSLQKWRLEQASPAPAPAFDPVPSA